MKTWILDILRCPYHTQEKTLELNDSRFICKICKNHFPIIDNIPDFLVLSTQNKNFIESEVKQWDEQANIYIEKRKNRIQYINCTNATVRLFKPQGNDLILDAGCGTGFVLQEYFNDALHLVAYDISFKSLFLLKKQFGNKLVYIRGDIASFPFAENVFTKVICANCIQQIPSDLIRQKSISEFNRVMKPNGQIVISAYAYSTTEKRAGWKKEGETNSPSGKIQYIYRFEKDEFKTLLNVFSRVRIFGASFPLIYRFKLGSISLMIERVLQRIQCIAHYGHMFVAIAQKKNH